MSRAFYSEKNPVTGRSVLWWVISFFAVIFIANGFFIYFALTSWTGLGTENAYEKGVRYNETLALAAAQRKLGWQSRVTLAAGNQLSVTLIDKNAKPLSGLKVAAQLIRPGKAESDQQVQLHETAPGIYLARVRFPHLGRWQVEIKVGKRYRLRHNIEVK